MIDYRERAKIVADDFSRLIGAPGRGGILVHGQYSIYADGEHVVLDQYTAEGWVRIGTLTTNPTYYIGFIDAGRIDVLAEHLADAMTRHGALGPVRELRRIAKDDARRRQIG